MCASRGTRSHEPQLYLPVAILSLLKGISSLCLTSTHTDALSWKPKGINLTLEEQLYPVYTEYMSQLNKHCHNHCFVVARELCRTHTQILCAQNIVQRVFFPCFASFAKALSLLSLSQLRLNLTVVKWLMKSKMPI